MSLKNLFFLHILLLFELFFIAKGEIISYENECAELNKINKELLLKISELEKRNQELEEELTKCKKEEEKEEEEEKEDENEVRIFKNLDSVLIENFEEFYLLYKRLKQNGKINDFKLLYRKSIDGKSAKDFHKKCDGIGKTVSIIKANTGYKFGGYSTSKWTENAFTWVYDDFDSFVFSFDLKAIYDATSTPNEKYHLGEYSGPQFWAFTLSDDTGEDPSDYTPYGDTLQIIYHDGNKHFSGFPSKYGINGGETYFYVSEMEVFQIVYEE